ncbi:hypothetical protein ACWGKO_16745 [Streptomyces griseoincarnatus]
MARDFANELARLAQEVKEIKRGQRYAHGGSLENSALEVKNTDGSLRAILGVQADGTTGVNIVNGPPPPTPSMPVLAPSIGGITVSWDGTFDGGAVPPLDWQRTEVHASTTSGFTPSPATLQTTIETLQGGTVVVPTEQPVYVRLLARNTSGTASDPTSEAGPLGPSPVVATELLDGIVTSSKLAQGAVTINALTESLADTAGQRYVDAMGDPDAWTVLSTTPGTTFTFLDGVTDARTGSTVAQATGFTVVRGNIQVPYDPEVLYRISARVRTTAASSSGSDTLYVGALGVAADGTTFVNRTGANSYFSQYQAAANPASQPTSAGWVTYTGYLRGRAASGTATASPDPRTPGVVHDNVRFISPLLYLNYASGASGGSSTTGTMQVDAFTVEALKTGVVDSTNLVSGSVTTAALAADSVTATAIAANAVTAGKILAGAVTAEKIDALAVTSDKVAANAITAGKINAGAVTADKLEAVLQLVTRLVAGDPSGARVELNSDGLRVYNSGGTQTIAFNAADGSGVFTGTITGSTITGGVVQTATSGQRITVNEAGQNKVLVYDSTGTAIGEFSAQGLLVRGTSGAIMAIDPNAVLPQIRFLNASGTNEARFQMAEVNPGDANIQMFTGTFTADGFTDRVWRQYMGNDFAMIERIRRSSTAHRGGRMNLRADFAEIGYMDSGTPSNGGYIRYETGLASTKGRHAVEPQTASANPALAVTALTGHTGPLLRLTRDTDKATVDKDGNAVFAGTVTSGGRPVPVPAAWASLTTIGWSTTPSLTAYQSIRIRTDGVRAYLDGAASTTAAFTGSRDAFTIPEGMRPLKDHYYGLVRATSGDPRFIGCRIAATGTITVFATTSVATTDTWDFSTVSWPLD